LSSSKNDELIVMASPDVRPMMEETRGIVDQGV